MMPQSIYRLLTDGWKDRRKETQVTLDLRQFHSVNLADIKIQLDMYSVCASINKMNVSLTEVQHNTSGNYHH